LWLDREGTGEKHDEQYAWYAFNNASAVEQDYSCLERMHVDYNGKTPGTYEFWWLRSTYDDASNGFWSVSSDGSPRYNSAGYSCGVVPVFSL
jgi:hypothetical protein